MTQAQLAEASRKTIETISNVERGVTIPSVQTLAIFAKVLRCSIGSFFGEDEKSLRSTTVISEAKLALLSEDDQALVGEFINLLMRRRREKE